LKLRAKIKNKYLKQILSGEKKQEYRQIESIILEDESGNEYEFEVNNIIVLPRYIIDALKYDYPDIEWDDSLPVLAIELGNRKEG